MTESNVHNERAFCLIFPEVSFTILFNILNKQHV